MSERQTVNQIIRLKQRIDELQLRKHNLAAKLGYGTFRSPDHPSLAVVIQRGSDGWKVDWKGIAEKLAEQFKANLDWYVVRHRMRHFRSPATTVKKVRVPK